MLRAILLKYKFIYIFSVQHLAPVFEAVSDAASNSLEIQMYLYIFSAAPSSSYGGCI